MNSWIKGTATDLLEAEGPDDDEEQVEEPEEGGDDQRQVPGVEALLRDVFNLENVLIEAQTRLSTSPLKLGTVNKYGPQRNVI